MLQRPNQAATLLIEVEVSGETFSLLVLTWKVIEIHNHFKSLLVKPSFE